MSKNVIDLSPGSRHPAMLHQATDSSPQRTEPTQAVSVQTSPRQGLYSSTYNIYGV